MSKVESKRTITTEIEDKKGKLVLIESDKKAYRENIDDALSDCRKRIQELRKENSKLRKQLYDRLKSDEHVINEAFQRKPADRAMFVKLNCTDALDTLNYKVCGKMKHLNLLKYLTENKCMQLESKENEYNNLMYEVTYVKDTAAGVNQEGQDMRNLENRLEKATLKYGEAEQINKIYIQIIGKLQAEQLHYGNTLDAMEKEIKDSKKELCNLQVMRTDAEMARNAAINEQRIKEDMVHQERKRREKELCYMKQVAENSQGHADKLDKKIPTRDSNQVVEIEYPSFMDQINEEQEAKMLKFKESYKQIQEISGVLSLQEAVLRFKNQNQTEIQLRRLIDDLEKQHIKLQREKRKFNSKFLSNTYESESMEYTDNDAIAGIFVNLNENEMKNKELKHKLSESNIILALCKLSAEHLNEILAEFQSALSADMNQKCNFKDFIIDLFNKLIIKCTNLMIEVDQTENIESYRKICFPPVLETYHEFFSNVMRHVSSHNTRIVIPSNSKNINDDDGHESGEDDNNVPSRRTLKKLAFQFVESKTKKVTKKKKKSKDK